MHFFSFVNLLYDYLFLILYFIFKSQIYIKKESERCVAQHQCDMKLDRDKGEVYKNIHKRKNSENVKHIKDK